MILLYVLLGNFITLICIIGLICVLAHNKDKIRKWLRNKKIKERSKN